MDEHEVLVSPKLYKRFVALLVDLVVCLQFFAFFQILINPILEKQFNYQELLVQYQDKLVEHGLGFYKYDEESQMNIYISFEVGEGENKVSQEEYDEASSSFKKDSNAMELSSKVNTITTLGTSVELLLALLPNYLLFPLIFKNGQTLGKKLMKIAIVDKKGCKISFLNLIMRNIVGLYLFDLLVSYFFMFIIDVPIIVVVSLIMALFTKGKRTIHDLIANTYVVDEEMSIIYVSLEEKNGLG